MTAVELLSVLLAVVAPRCRSCSRAATRHNASKQFGDAATDYACDECAKAIGGRWNDLPASGAIREAEAIVEVREALRGGR